MLESTAVLVRFPCSSRVAILACRYCLCVVRVRECVGGMPMTREACESVDRLADDLPLRRQCAGLSPVRR